MSETTPEIQSPPSPAAPVPKGLLQCILNARAKMKPPVKSCTVEYMDRKSGKMVQFSYADIADLIEAVMPPLLEEGVLLSHNIGFNGHEGRFGLLTVLTHVVTGAKVDTWYPLDIASATARAQDFASQLTYARRYSVSSLLSIASEDDDDGARASSPGPREQRPPNPQQGQQTRVKPVSGGKVQQGAPGKPPEPVGPPTGGELANLFRIVDNSEGRWSREQVKKFLEAKWKLAGTVELTRAQFTELMNEVVNRTYRWAMDSTEPAPGGTGAAGEGGLKAPLESERGEFHDMP